MQPLFSIIAPTMGRTDLWQHALRSLAKQDFDDFEIIAVDSRKSPESKRLVESLTQRRVTYLTPQETESRFNWDIGFRSASGKYILWLDDDNYLLPHALRTLAKTITEHEPDIVTGDHVHWYDTSYPELKLRNHASIPFPLFDHATRRADPHDYLRPLFGTGSFGPGAPRYHFSETAIRKTFVDEILARAGRIDFTTTSPRFMQLVFLACARDVWHVRSPIAIIIQMRDSMAFQWSKKEARKKRFASTFAFSPVSGDVYINYATENLLRAKHDFPDAFKDIDVAWESFFGHYARELSYLDQGWGDFFKTWREWRAAAKSRGVSTSFWRSVLYAAAVKLLKDMRLYGLVRHLTAPGARPPKHSTLVSMEQYSVHTIAECADALPRAIKEEFNIPYTEFSGTTPPQQGLAS